MATISRLSPASDYLRPSPVASTSDHPAIPAPVADEAVLSQEDASTDRRYRDRRKTAQYIPSERRSGFDRRTGRYYATFLIKA